MAAPRVFVSHSHRDNEYTQRLVDDLRAAGADVWVDIADLRDSDFMERINAALANCDWVVLVQTRNSLASQAVRMEINAALNLVLQRRIRAVIPFIAESVSQADVPPTWSTLHHYDASVNYSQALTGLLRALGLAPVVAPPVVAAYPPAPQRSHPVQQHYPQPTQPRSNQRASLTSNMAWRRVVPAVAIVLVVAVFGVLLRGAGLGPFASGADNRTPTATTTLTSVSCPSTSTVASWHLVQPGQFTVASDTTYAPAEFEDPSHSGQYIGFDIDLATEVSRRLCATAHIVKADFGSIISDISGPALGSQRYDTSFSSFTINDSRLSTVMMIPYLQAGESILVAKGNPKNIHTIANLCGKNVAVQDSTVEYDELSDANGKGPGTTGQTASCASNNIRIFHDPDQNLVTQQVVSGSADAMYADEPIVGYAVSKNASKVEDGGRNVPAAPEGIVIRKDNPDLQSAIRSALKAMITDGKYSEILQKWGVSSCAFTSGV